MPNMHEYLSTAPVTSWVSGDMMLLCRDPAGTPLTKGITLDNLFQTIATNVKLPATTATVGTMYLGGVTFLHNFKHPTGRGQVGDEAPVGENVFLGELAGNLTAGAQATHLWQASKTVGIGHEVLNNITLAGCNTAVGWWCMRNDVDGDDNVAVGCLALTTATNPLRNCAIGYGGCHTLASGNYNTTLGYYALFSATAGNSNVCLGPFAGYNQLTDSNRLFVNNVQHTTLANDQNFSLLYGVFSGGADSLENQTLTCNGEFHVNALGSTSTVGVVASFGTRANTAPTGRSFSIQVNKYGTAGGYFGINKDTASGAIPENSFFIGGDQIAATMCFCRNLGTFGSSLVDLFISATGAVGVGTTTPQGPLDIWRSTAINGPMLCIRSSLVGTNGKHAMIRFGDQSQTTLYQKGAIVYEGVSDAARGRFHICLENTEGATSVALSDARLTVESNGTTTITGALKSGANVGAKAGANVAATEYGDGTIHQTVLTFTAQEVTINDPTGAAGYGAFKCYDFPEGAIVILAAVANLTLTAGAGGISDTFNGDFAVGTVGTADSDFGDAGEATIIASTATPAASGGVSSAKGQSAASLVVDGTGTAADLYLNLLVDDGDISAADTIAVGGTLTITWVKAGYY